MSVPQSEVNIQNLAQETMSTEKYECLPLKQRLKLLLASRRSSVDYDVKKEIDVPANWGDEKRNEGCLLQSGCSAVEKTIEAVSRKERHAGDHVEFNCPLRVKVEQADYVENQSADCTNGSSCSGVQVVNSKADMSSEYLDELDHVVLKERLRRFLTRTSSGLTATILLESSPEISCQDSPDAGTGKGVHIFGDHRLSMDGNKIFESGTTLKSGHSNCNANLLGKTRQPLSRSSGGNRSPSATDSSGIEKNDRTYSSENKCSKYKSNGRKVLLSGETGLVEHEAVPNLTNIKVEPQNYSELQPSNATRACQMSSKNLALAKTEVEIHDDLYEDKLDHMLLRERMKFLSRDDQNLSLRSKCMSKTIPSSLGCRSVSSTTTQSVKVNRSRKRQKTVTDSIETAMEEDAPGLLQVLVERGVSVTEIQLYGEPESNDALDDSTTDGSFAKLEEVISKLFFKRESSLKLGHLRGTKVEKASYCLECLFALVEQARYLQFRNWPVEWGWCRELQSFIFVFEKHNRIVLERPEYGYATYFFELADSLPINWQIKRLVIAMKLTSCSRVTLIENKALAVGDDLTEGEARVLMEYGWIPNTGLGTLLNYYDRVVHDRKNNKDSSEWRSKIGKVLMEGLSGGTLISAGIPTNAMEYNVAHPAQIKLELN